jgi:hypothetical protein
MTLVVHGKLTYVMGEVHATSRKKSVEVIRAPTTPNKVNPLRFIVIRAIVEEASSGFSSGPPKVFLILQYILYTDHTRISFPRLGISK